MTATRFTLVFACLGLLWGLLGPLLPLATPAPGTRAGAGALASPALAQVPGAASGVSPWVETGSARLRLESATTATGTADHLSLGLAFDLKKPWKIYWRSPGDAGYPPRLDWSGSVNLKTATVHWPVPRRLSVSGIETIGYDQPVTLPLTIEPEQPGDPVILALAVDFLACDEICVPESARLSLILPPGPAVPSDQAHALARARALVPGPATSHGLTVENAGIEPGGWVRVIVAADPPVADPDLFLEAPPGISFAPPRVALADDGHRAVLRARIVPESLPADARAALTPAPTSPSPEATSPGSDSSPRGTDQGTPDPLLTMPLAALVVAGDRGVETPIATDRLAEPWAGATDDTSPKAPSAPFAPPILAGPGDGGVWGLVVLMGTALVGGLILNLMPCVLPVLSLKILGLLGHGGGAIGPARRAFLATSAGIVFSFLVLAAGAIALKAAGAAVGWGLQFQQPLFITGMMALLTLFVAALWGLIAIPLPGFVAALGAGPAGAAEERQSLLAHFATGAFATVLATPCSAPILGTAVGFALAGGAVATLGTFALMGLGMAAPFLVIAAWPGFATRLPRPGPWMVTVKALMGLALAGTAVWLGLVLWSQVGARAALVVGALLVVVLAGLAVLRIAPAAPRWLRRLGGGLVVGLLAAAFVVPGVLDSPPQARPLLAPGMPAPADGEDAAPEGVWRRWSPATLADQVAAGSVVLVDVTASWCATCQVNKATVLNRGRVAALLTEGRVIGLRADWSRPDPEITDYLMLFGRFGIPFNAVYGPQAPEGLALPELLTEAVVLDAIRKAGGSTDPAPRP